MGKAVEQCACQSFRTEDRSPLIEWQVAGHQGGASLISLTEDFKEQFCADGCKRNVSHLVHYE